MYGTGFPTWSVMSPSTSAFILHLTSLLLFTPRTFEKSFIFTTSHSDQGRLWPSLCGRMKGKACAPAPANVGTWSQHRAVLILCCGGQISGGHISCCLSQRCGDNVRGGRDGPKRKQDWNSNQDTQEGVWIRTKWWRFSVNLWKKTKIWTDNLIRTCRGLNFYGFTHKNQHETCLIGWLRPFKCHSQIDCNLEYTCSFEGIHFVLNFYSES